MARYENLFSYVANLLRGRYNIDDNIFKVKLIKYISYYISNVEAVDDYMISLADFPEFKTVNKKINKRLKIVGLGGVGGNFLTYIVLSGIFFDEVVVYEFKDEVAELHNSIRYFIFNPFAEISKNELFKRFVNLFNRKDIIFANEKYNPDVSDDDFIIFGAPNVETRIKIVNLNLKYIFLLHHNNEFFIFTNINKKYRKYEPSGLPLSEEYGLINLSSFFSNLIENFEKIFMEVIGK